jgi:anti-sigma factor RsiW
MNEHLSELDLHAYLDDELVEAARLAVEVHLRACRDCQVRLEALRGLFAQIESTPDEPLARDLSAEVLASLQAQKMDSHRLRRLGIAELAAGLLTLAAILAGGIPLPFVPTETLAASLQAGWSDLLMTAEAEAAAVLIEAQVGLDQAGQALRSWQPGEPVMPLWWLWLILAVVLWIVANRILLGDDPRLNRAGKVKGAKHG